MVSVVGGPLASAAHHIRKWNVRRMYLHAQPKTERFAAMKRALPRRLGLSRSGAALR